MAPAAAVARGRRRGGAFFLLPLLPFLVKIIAASLAAARVGLVAARIGQVVRTGMRVAQAARAVGGFVRRVVKGDKVRRALQAVDRTRRRAGGRVGRTRDKVNSDPGLLAAAAGERKKKKTKKLGAAGLAAAAAAGTAAGATAMSAATAAGKRGRERVLEGRRRKAAAARARARPARPARPRAIASRSRSEWMDGGWRMSGRRPNTGSAFGSFGSPVHRAQQTQKLVFSQPFGSGRRAHVNRSRPAFI